MSNHDANQSFAQHAQALRVSYRANLVWALDRYHPLQGRDPRIDYDVIVPGWWEAEYTFAQRRFGLPRPQKWIETREQWSELLYTADADAMKRTRDEVWRQLQELCSRHDVSVPTPPWMTPEITLETEPAPSAPPYLSGRAPPPYTANELEAKYRTAFQKLRDEDGMHPNEMTLAVVAAEMGQHRTVLSRWNAQLGLGDWRPLRTRLLKD